MLHQFDYKKFHHFGLKNISSVWWPKHFNIWFTSFWLLRNTSTTQTIFTFCFKKYFNFCQNLLACCVIYMVYHNYMRVLGNSYFLKGSITASYKLQIKSDVDENIDFPFDWVSLEKLICWFEVFLKNNNWQKPIHYILFFIINNN